MSPDRKPGKFPVSRLLTNDVDKGRNRPDPEDGKPEPEIEGLYRRMDEGLLQPEQFRNFPIAPEEK